MHCMAWNSVESWNVENLTFHDLSFLYLFIAFLCFRVKCSWHTPGPVELWMQQDPESCVNRVCFGCFGFSFRWHEKVRPRNRLFTSRNSNWIIWILQMQTVASWSCLLLWRGMLWNHLTHSFKGSLPNSNLPHPIPPPTKITKPFPSIPPMFLHFASQYPLPWLFHILPPYPCFAPLGILGLK